MKCFESSCQSNDNISLCEKLTLLGSETFKSLLFYAKLSKCIRVKSNECKVTWPLDSFKNLKDMIIPKFKTVQTVTINEKNQMVCTCCYSFVHGFPCVDMICVSLTFPKS